VKLSSSLDLAIGQDLVLTVSKVKIMMAAILPFNHTRTLSTLWQLDASRQCQQGSVVPHNHSSSPARNPVRRLMMLGVNRNSRLLPRSFPHPQSKERPLGTLGRLKAKEFLHFSAPLGRAETNGAKNRINLAPNRQPNET
jgi:hypothetical protein